MGVLKKCIIQFERGAQAPFFLVLPLVRNFDLIAVEFHPGMTGIQSFNLYNFSELMIDENFNKVIAKLVKIYFVSVIPDGYNKPTVPKKSIDFLI